MKGVLDLALAMHCDKLAIRAQWALDRRPDAAIAAWTFVPAPSP